MTEEKKECAQTGSLKTILKVILGLALLALGASCVWLWRFDLLIVIRGCLGAVIILAGVIFLAIAKE